MFIFHLTDILLLQYCLDTD